MISFTPRPLYVPLYRRMSGPATLSRRAGDSRYLLLLPGTEPEFLDRPALSLVTILIFMKILPLQLRAVLSVLHSAVEISTQ
jgi:hypothetical protein